MTEAITILRPTVASGRDAQGNPNKGADQAIVSPGWAVAPISVEESALATGQSAIAGFTLYLRDAWADVRTSDRVIVRGDTYAVVSASNKWLHPVLGFRGTAVSVRREI